MFAYWQSKPHMVWPLNVNTGLVYLKSKDALLWPYTQIIDLWRGLFIPLYAQTFCLYQYIYLW